MRDNECLKIGDSVGLGRVSESDMTRPQCLSGNQYLSQKAEQTIVGRPRAFADRVRCHWSWAVRLPDALDPGKAGHYSAPASQFQPDFAI